MALGTVGTASRATSGKNCKTEAQTDDADVSLKEPCSVYYTQDAQETNDLAGRAAVPEQSKIAGFQQNRRLERVQEWTRREALAIIFCYSRHCRDCALEKGLVRSDYLQKQDDTTGSISSQFKAAGSFPKITGVAGQACDSLTKAKTCPKVNLKQNSQTTFPMLFQAVASRLSAVSGNERSRG